MTPALLASLADFHRSVHDPKAARRAEQGTATDLAMLATMKAR